MKRLTIFAIAILVCCIVICPVERDGLIITGNGPTAASQFGKTIIEALKAGQ